ncbi:transposase domain-containing protein [Pseudomonadota bacterium]
MIETAKANGREPYNYLRRVLTNLPAAETADDIEAMLPFIPATTVQKIDQ